MTTLLYKELAGLDRKAHAKLRIKKSDNLDFADNINSAPLAGIEFFEASRDFPVLFAKGENGEIFSLALFSLQKQSHSVEDWSEVYIPAFIRRYPFAKAGDGNVVIDIKAPQLQEEEGDPLFKEDGTNSEFLDTVIGFLNHMETQYKVTKEYCQACAERELLTPFNVQVSVSEDEKPIRLDTLYVIDEKKLNELPDEQVTDWFRKGWLGWSFAHLHSLGAMRRLVKRDRKVVDMKEEPAET